jgi:predicted RNase H-like nuclease (RuvC/YqgF family)
MVALVIALVAQVMLALALYGLLQRSSYLSTRYKQIKGDQKQSQKQLSQQQKDLKNTGTVEEKNKILQERIIGLEALNKQLETQANMMQDEQKQLGRQLEKLNKQHEKDVKKQQETSVVDSAKSLLDKFK